VPRPYLVTLLADLAPGGTLAQPSTADGLEDLGEEITVLDPFDLMAGGNGKTTSGAQGIAMANGEGGYWFIPLECA